MELLDVVALLRAAQTLERHVNVALMYSGLRLPQYRLLDTLAALNQTTVSELSERLRITRATASVMINELIRSGDVMMSENPTDRRSFFLRLTEHGLSRLQSARRDVGVLTNQLSKNYSPAFLQTLNEFAYTIPLK